MTISDILVNENVENSARILFQHKFLKLFVIGTVYEEVMYLDEVRLALGCDLLGKPQSFAVRTSSFCPI